MKEKFFVLLGSLNVCISVHFHVHHPMADSKLTGLAGQI